MPFWEKCVLNIVSSKDDDLKYMPKADWMKMLGMHMLFGKGTII